MATNYLSDEEVFGTSNYLSEDEVFGTSEKGGRQDLPEDIKPSEGRSATPMGGADPRIVQPRDDRGVIQRVGDFLKPAPKSVMEGYVPTAQEQQADVDRRLSYGAGPISSQAAAAADAVRSSRGQMVSKDPTVNKIVKSMDARGDKGLGDLVVAANDPTNIRSARDTKAQEFRSAGEWAADTLSSLSQGAVGLVQLPISIISPSSDIAATLRDTQKQLQAQESDVLRAQREQLRERVQNEDGFFDKYTATVLQLVTSPALGLSEAVKQVPNFLGIVGASRLVGAASAGGVALVGRASPTVALGEAISGGVIQAGARAAGTTAGGVGASMVMAGGDAAGGVYDKLTDPKQTPLSVWQQNPDYQTLTAAGKSSKDAIEEIATAKARMAALVTAPLGLLGFAGAEAAIASRGLGKATAEALTFAGAGKMLAKDLVGEQLEEGGTQFGGNVISRTVDPRQKLTEGVPEAMATALVTSAPFSAAGAASRFQEARAAQAPDIAAERQAVRLFDVNSYDPTLVDPRLTSRQLSDTGPSAPINFTPSGSPSQAAGLVDIVIPSAPETTNVGTTGSPPLGASTGGQPASDQFVGGLDASGLAVDDANQQRGGVAGAAATNDGTAVSIPSGAGQPLAGLNRPFARATDQDLLARAEASIAGPQNNNDVVQPAEQWFGRKGDGYVTQGDAQQALPGRQRIFPALSWSVEQMPGGKFRLAGYSSTQETTLGNQTPQAIQGQAQGQAPAIAGAAGAGVGQPLATGGATQAQGGGNIGLGSVATGPVAGPRPAGALATPEGATAAGLTSPIRLAPPAPLRAVGKAITALKASTGIDAEIDGSPMTEQQQAASVVARLSGRTVTILKAATPGSMPNGFMVPGDDKNIFIANDTDDAPLTVAMHEIYHTLPEPQRLALNKQLAQYFRQDRRAEFATEFQYDSNNDSLLDEEIPAFMVQAISKRADFWQDLRTKMGNAEFAEVAKTILAKLNTIIGGAKAQYGDEFVNKYITDVAKARDLLTTAYTQAMQEQGLTPDVDTVGDVMMARRAKTNKVGEFDVATAKDGSLTVYGDSEAIRAQIPDNVQGRVTKEGITFTNAAAPRVRAALEGRQVAYSRGGQVTEKLPMKDGKYLGAPEKFNTPGKIPTLRKILRQLADEGAPGRYWYENSGKEVLKMVGGDVNEARKFVALLAIYSPQAKVDANSTFALRAWAQYKAGQPISVKTGVMDSKAKSALDNVDEFWSGEKTGNFFFNLLREIDPTTEGKQGATIDMWMMRAGQYDNDAPTGTQYSFMENETNRLAQELGWEPQQVQAAIWVAMKARMENSGVKKATEASSEKKGWLRYDYPLKNGKPFKTRVIIEPQKHRDNWLKYSFAHDVTKDDTQQAKFDFGDGLKRHIGQMSFEARPGRTTGVLPGIHSAPYAQQVEFQQAVQKTFLDERGNDLLAMRLGLLVDSDILAPGVWQGEISPSTQLGVAMAPAKGDEGKTNVDPAQAKALNVYAAIAGLVARQEGVGWHRPFYASTKRDANGLDIRVGRPLNPREVADLETAVGQWMADNGYQGWQDQFAFISSPNGIRLVNFGIITNEKLHADILRVAESVLPDADAQWFASSGDMMTNNWKENQNGQDYVERTRSEGRSDVLDWARAYLAPKVQRVFDDFSERYDWGTAGELKFSNRAGPAEPARGPSARPDARDGSTVTGIHYGKAAGLSRLSGAQFGSGIKGAEQARLAEPGVDPRIKKRVYFYLTNNNADMPRPEVGLGSHAYRATLGNMYDASKASDMDVNRVRSMAKGSGPNAFESAILDAGYRGYVNREQGTAVVLNADVPVAYEGLAQAGKMRDRNPERIVPKNRTRTEGNELVRRPSNDEMGAIVNTRPALAKAAPSFRLQFGEARVAKDEAGLVDQVLANAGSSFRFGEPAVMASNRAAPDTPAFRKWFGDSKVVDASGKPLVVYHGTNKNQQGEAFTMLDAYGSNYGLFGQGAYLTADPSVASEYTSKGRGDSPSVYPLYASIKNPIDMDAEADPQQWIDAYPDFDIEAYHEGGSTNESYYRAAEEAARDEGMEQWEGAEAMQDGLRRMGHDGITHIGGGRVRSEGKKHRVFIAFDPEQIKSATGNSGEFDAKNQDIRQSNRRQKLIGTNFEVEATGNIDLARIKLQDDALRMKRVIEAVKAKGGTVGEAQNFYDANTLMPGRVQAAIDDFKDNIVRPLLDQAAEYGIDMNELSMYAYAKHAKERNAYIASINRRLPDGGSGMTDAEADSILQMVNITGDTAKFDDLHQRLMAITSATRQTMLAEGLITQDEFDAMTNAYQNYIPLRGFENVVEETGVARPGVGRGVNIRGAETIRAMGRKSKAGDLIENVIRDYERVVSRVEKNDVGKVLLDFVLSNPDPDLWGVDVERSKPGYNKATGTVQYTKAIEKGDDTIGVKVGGQQVYIKFADKELARALRQAWKDETSGLERATLAMTGWWNNWMRAVLTKYNPAFALINIPRDALWSGTASALAELGPKGLARYLAVYPKALMASARKEAGVAGTTSGVFGNPQMDARFAEFRSAGGITGGFFMRSLEDINQDMRNDLLLSGAAARNPWESIKSLPPFKLAKMTLRLLEFMGSASENATRFALYQASRELGNSPAKAAILAKDGTTNFNRKGEWGGSLNNLYLFFNAAVQGNAQLFKVLKSPAVQASMAGVTGVGMMLALYGASAGGEDDDGEAYWDKIPSYIKERNMVIMLPPGDALAGGIERAGKRGRYVTIPVQYGFNIFPNMGYTIADVLRNQADPKRGMTPTKAALHMTSTVFGSVNPFGGAVDFSDGVQVLLAAMPTLVDLPIQLITERGTFGSPSSPVKSPFDKRPDSERMFTSQQDSVSAKIAKVINELGGGNEAKSGSILGMDSSVAPGTIQTLIGATTGGLGTFVEQVGTAMMSMTGDDKNLKANKIPFLNKFYGEVDEGANIKAAGDRMREVRALADEVKAQQKLGLDPELTDKEERLMLLSTMQETYQRQSTLIRKRELEIIKDKKMTDAEKTLERKRLQVDRDKLSTDMNREYLRAVPK